MKENYRLYFSELLKISDNLVGTQHRVVISRASLQSPAAHLPEWDSPAWLPSASEGIARLFRCLLGHPSGELLTDTQNKTFLIGGKKKTLPPLNKEAQLKNPKLLCNLPNWSGVNQSCFSSSARASGHRGDCPRWINNTDHRLLRRCQPGGQLGSSCCQPVTAERYGRDPLPTSLPKASECLISPGPKRNKFLLLWLMRKDLPRSPNPPPASAGSRAIEAVS